MLKQLLSAYTVILASRSPRRHELLHGMDVDYKVITKETDESFPENLKGHEIALYLCKRKAEAFAPHELPDNYLLITADTIVLAADTVLNKAESREEAIQMLLLLSGRKHLVITGVCLRKAGEQTSFYDTSEVHFGPLSRAEIEWYVDRYKPYDKAGSYGIQEWIGYVGIESVTGSYFNVMGLPTFKLYHELKHFAGKPSKT